ncbi:MAG: hypothetical protein WBO89_08390 [Propionicimonas sp.]
MTLAPTLGSAVTGGARMYPWAFLCAEQAALLWSIGRRVAAMVAC